MAARPKAYRGNPFFTTATNPGPIIIPELRATFCVRAGNLPSELT